MSFARGSTLPIHHVKCRTCRVPLQRKSHWRNPVCAGCSRKSWKGKEAEYTRRIRQEARRYRILLAVGPYSSFEEMLKAMRIRSPRTRSGSYDMALEERSR